MDQIIDFMPERLAAGDFYILSPDNDGFGALDEKRILRAEGDIVDNRPPLPRWHKDWRRSLRGGWRGEIVEPRNEI